MANHFERSLQNDLQKHFESGLGRTLVVGKPERIDFTSNDYLGFARSQELYSLILERCERVSQINGSTGSRLLSGNSSYAEELEDKLSGIFKSEATLHFNSGYSANLAVLSSLPKKSDTILYDELSHASLKDGARLSLAKRYSFRHNDMSDLEKKIKLSAGKVFVVVESIYSMDGDESPLEDLAALRGRDDRVVLVVDEAHSTGIVGARGGGLVVAKGLEKFVDVRIHTFGKAMGSHGACVAGSGLLRPFLINFARPFIYTTAPPIHSIASVDCAFDLLEKNITLQNDLLDRIRWYQSLAPSGDFKNATTPIQTVMVAGNENVRQVARSLQSVNLDVRPILAPTVPKGMERLRICLHTYNTREQIERLCFELKKLQQYQS